MSIRERHGTGAQTTNSTEANRPRGGATRRTGGQIVVLSNTKSRDEVGANNCFNPIKGREGDEQQMGF